jgi:hypothetical protein
MGIQLSLFNKKEKKISNDSYDTSLLETFKRFVGRIVSNVIEKLVVWLIILVILDFALKYFAPEFYYIVFG